MAQNQNWGFSGGGGFLQVLGIIYLVKLIRRHREQRRPTPADGPGMDPTAREGEPR